MPWLMPIKRYCQFYGRSGRAEFWQFAAFAAIAVTIAAALDYSLQGPYGAPVLTALAYLAIALPGYAVLFRRLHDRNLSGWLCGTVMMLNGIYFTVANFRLGFLGTPAETAYDPIVDGSLALTVLLVGYILVQAALPSDPQPNRFGERLTDTSGPGPGAADLNARAKALLSHLAKPTIARHPDPAQTVVGFDTRRADGQDAAHSVVTITPDAAADGRAS